MKRVKIGISANTIVMGEANTINMPRSYVNEDYVISVEQAGGVPVILPVVKDIEVLKEQLEGLDGLILSGGSDIDPAFYGEEPLPQCGYINPAVDAYSIALVKEAVRKEIPVLGICKGNQVINVAFGGSLYQDIPTSCTNVFQHVQLAPRNSPTHFINTENHSFLNELFGKRIRVNSFHHQSVKKVADGFFIGAKSDDGIVESIEKKDGSFVVGVQFHPEMMASHQDPNMMKLFEAFVGKCKENAGK